MLNRGAKRPAHPRSASAVLVVLTALVMLVPTGVSAHGLSPTPGVQRGGIIYPAQANFTVRTVDYNSSVDGFLLSYSEILPLNFSPSLTYPLAIELHGINTAGSTPLSGGYPTPVTNTTADAAVAAGFLLIVINTRTGDGYYVDSKYTGPQGQDVLDAIAHEESLRHIGKLYVFGFSMGSMGAISLGLNHPGMFAGIGGAAAFSDDFELEARLVASSNEVLEQAGLLPTGTFWPNASAYAQGIFAELSPLRWHPQNASGIRIWIAGGGNDVFATNNLTFWPYEQANDTVLDSTCLVATSVGEPASCTVPLAVLRAEDPSNYSYRYVFEPNGFHAYDLLNATDMFAYFEGKAAPGAYWGYFPDPTLLPQPVPLVTLVTEPTGCGAFALGGTFYPSMESIPIHPTWVPVVLQPCQGMTLGSVTAAGGVTYNPANSTAFVADSGSLLARFVAPSFQVRFSADTVCSSVLFGGTLEVANATPRFAPGTYLASAEPCAGYAFSSWATSGGLAVSNVSAATTTVNVTGDGTLTVGYVKNPAQHPIVAVTVTSAPASCAPLQFGGAGVPAGTVLEVPTGSYNVSASACSGYIFVAWSASGGLILGAAAPATTVSVTSAGTLTAVYAPLGTAGESTIGVLITPAGCGAVVTISGVSYPNASSVLLGPGIYSISAGACLGFRFVGWTTTGELAVSGSTLTVSGNGTLLATFTSNGGPGGTTTDNATGVSLTTEAEWIVVGAAVGVAAGALIVFALLRSRARVEP